MRFGPWEVRLIRAGFFRLDGGAMFGTVPKTIWAKLMAPDGENRILMTCNCLVAVGELGGRRHVVLVEAGVGTKGDALFRERLGVEDADALVEGLAALGIVPEEVTEVLLSHLHLDHAGGCTRLEAGGEVVPTFPKARHIVSARDLQDAKNPPPRARASYLEADWRPLETAGLLETVEGEVEVLPGLSVLPLPGHNPGNQGIVFTGGDRRLVYAGDLIPTRHHLPPTWAMAYDLDVNRCVDERSRLLEALCDTDDLLVLDHEIEHPVGRIRRDAKGRYVLEPVGLT